MLRVQVLVPNAEQMLLPGMYTDVTFKASRAKPPLRVPAAALCLRPTGPQVAVVSADGRVTFHPIQIGRDNGDYIEVSSGLTGDETVALNIGSDIVDGSHIEARTIQAMDTTTTPKPAATVSAVLHPAVAPGSASSVH
jgi:multidrug efflux pump subunit AcrA (membrane-fusion protein)